MTRRKMAAFAFFAATFQRFEQKQEETIVREVEPPRSRLSPLIITWYGRNAHGNTMANGKKFNMFNPRLAASPSLPFGTKIELWHKGTRLLVEVTDRMPENTPWNQIDVSWAGAHHLGLTGVGRTVILGRVLV